MCGNLRAPPWSEGGAFSWSSEKSGRRRLRFDLPSVTPPGPSQMDKTLQRKCLALMSAVTPAKVYCCLFIIAVLTTSVIVLSIVLSARKEKRVVESPKYAAWPKSWVRFRSKCFYFSEDIRNWILNQTFCVSLEASLAQFATMEELNFLKRYKAPSNHWIGLRRESSHHIWRWMDNTEYNNTHVLRLLIFLLCLYMVMCVSCVYEIRNVV
uniref:C-type lectin domain-containing protein n=1 Tax=Macaca fascicularis TaxID=9541 RepID=A0A7N9CMI8_MACFA